MADYLSSIRNQLASGPKKANNLAVSLGVSQPTISRALSKLSEEIIKFGRARSIQYAIRDSVRGIDDVPIYRVDSEGKIHTLGTLVAVRPEGYLMIQEDGLILHSEGLPWWLYDMRPQGYLGRLYASIYSPILGLPEKLQDWRDSHILRALMTASHDAIGNLLLGNQARSQFLSNVTSTEPILSNQKQQIYPQLAERAANGEEVGSSAGGEQPKFTAYVLADESESHLIHVIVKFNIATSNPVSERWGDLLRAEHLALNCLRVAGIAAANSSIVCAGHQVFLETQRFDRIGKNGRKGLFSLEALDAEYVGSGIGDWPSIAVHLASSSIITQEAANGSTLLYAFGKLIGNTDMHNGNISYIDKMGQPYSLAPAYDMLPMVFAPRTSGDCPNTLTPPSITANINNATWIKALSLARQYLEALENHNGFSPNFLPCITAIRESIENSAKMINQLGELRR